MPRTEARLKCSLWDDRNFVALPIDAKALYWTVISQPGMSHAGVLPLPRREWVNLFPDDDIRERLALARKILEERQYLVIDEDTDEVLVRTYIKHDIIDGPPGTFRAAMDAVKVVRSPRLRAVLRRELLRLDVDVIKAKANKTHRAQPIDAYHSALASLGDPGDGGVPEPAGHDEYVWPTEPSDPPDHAMGHAMGHAMRMASSPHRGRTSSDAMRDGMVDASVEVEVVGAGSSPVVEVDLIKASPRASAPAPARERLDVRAARLVGTALPRGIGRGARGELTAAVQRRLDDEVPDQVVLAALARWVSESKASARAIEWMLDDAIKESHGASPTRRGGRPSTADIFAAGSSLVAKYEAEEAAEAEYSNVRPIARGAS